MTKLKSHFLPTGDCRWHVHLAFTTETSSDPLGVTFICDDTQLDMLLLTLLPVEEGSKSRRELVETFFRSGGPLSMFNTYSVDADPVDGAPISFEKAMEKIPPTAKIKGIGVNDKDISEILLGSPFFSTQENTLDLIKQLVEKTDRLKITKGVSTTPDDEISTTEEVEGSLGYSKFIASLGNKND